MALGRRHPGSCDYCPLLAARSLLAPSALALSPDLRITAALSHSLDGDRRRADRRGVPRADERRVSVAGCCRGTVPLRRRSLRAHRQRCAGSGLPSSNIMTLFAPRSGGLWLGYRFGGASFIDDGKVTNYGEREGLPAGSVTRFAQDDSGVIWANTTWGLKRLDGSLWKDVRETLQLGLGVREDLARRARRNAVDRHRPRRHDSCAAARPCSSRRTSQTSEADVDFVEAPDGTLWLTDASLGARAVYVPGGGRRAADWIAIARRTPQAAVGQAHRSRRHAVDGVVERHSSVEGRRAPARSASRRQPRRAMPSRTSMA